MTPEKQANNTAQGAIPGPEEAVKQSALPLHRQTSGCNNAVDTQTLELTAPHPGTAQYLSLTHSAIRLGDDAVHAIKQRKRRDADGDVGVPHESKPLLVVEVAVAVERLQATFAEQFAARVFSNK